MKHPCLHLSIPCAAVRFRVPALAGPPGCGFRAAYGETNKAGNVRGRKLRPVLEDGGHEPANPIEAAKKLPDRPIRRAFLAKIPGHSFDLDGFKLIFAPGGNHGFHAVLLTAPQPDGTFAAIAGASKAFRPARAPQEQAGRR